MYLAIIKAICDKPIANIVLSGAKLKAFSSIRNKIGCPPSPCLVSRVPEVPARAVMQEKEIKGFQWERKK